MSLECKVHRERQTGEKAKEIQAQITEDLEEQVEGLRCDSLKEAGPAFPTSGSYREGPARLEAQLAVRTAICHQLTNGPLSGLTWKRRPKATSSTPLR